MKTKTRTTGTAGATGAGLNFDTTPQDTDLILAIVRRADAMGRQHGVHWGDRLSLSMDLSAVHLNGCPLRLAALAAAPDFDFAHDVAGIVRHLDRRTGKLRDHFLPRFAAPEPRR